MLATSEHRISNLDGIRGIAIAFVLVYHSTFLPWASGHDHSVFFKVYWHISISLWVGVDIFFVLSGFLITSILIRTCEAKNYYTGFYGRRVIRIVPMFVIVLSLVGSFLLWKGQCTVWQVLFTLLSLGNWLVIPGLAIYPLSHFWSLAVEEQFYLAWPVVARILTPLKLVKLCLALFGVAALLRIILALAETNDYVIYQITPTHWGGLALGSLLACLPACPNVQAWFLKNFRKIIVVSLICLIAVFAYGGFVLYPSNFSFALGLPFVELLAMGLVYTALKVQKGGFFNILNSSILQWLGRYSYSIYLLHFPFLVVANWLIGDGKLFFMNLLILVGIYLGLSLLLARLAWDLVEQPFMNLKPKFKPEFIAPSSCQ